MKKIDLYVNQALFKMAGKGAFFAIEKGDQTKHTSPATATGVSAKAAQFAKPESKLAGQCI